MALVIFQDGQSNRYSFTGYDISGAPGTNESASGADFGLHVNTPFPAVTMNQLLSQAPAVPPAQQTFSIATGPVALQNFAAAGQFNAGSEQAARLFVSLGIDAAPYVAKCAIGSTSIVKHWGKLSGFPAGAPITLYQQRINFYAGIMSAIGRGPDAFHYGMGETAAATPAEVTSAPSDNKTWYDNTCDDLGISRNIPIIARYLNPHQAAGDVAGYNAALDAWAALDPRVILIKVDDLFLRSDPHYAFNEQYKIGQREVIATWRAVRPSVNIRRGTGPLAYYQSAGPLCTSQGGTSPSVPHGGEFAEPGDLDIAYALSYTAATTHTFTQPASGTAYTQIGGQVDSVLSSSHQAMTVWMRVLAASDIDSAGRTVGPTITFGSSTLNRAKRILFKNVNPTTPIAAFLTGANNANSTALTIGASSPAVPAGCLAVAIVGSAKSGGGQAVSTLTSAGFASAFTNQYDGEANPGAGIVHSAFGTAPLSGTTLQPATVAFAQAGINVGFLLAIAPNLEGAGAGDLGADQASSAGLISLPGAAAGSLAPEQAAGTGVIALSGSAAGDLGADQAAAVGLVSLAGAAAGDLGSDLATAAGLVSLSGAALGDLGGDQALAVGTIAPPPPYTYSTIDDAINAIGAPSLIQLSDLDNRGVVDTQRVIAAILCADAIINSYIGKRYAVPLAVIPQTIATLSCNMALRFLRQRAYKVQPLQEDIEQDKVDRDWLLGIANGTISIGVDTRPPKASDRIDVGQAPRESSRHMSLRRMKGFI